MSCNLFFRIVEGVKGGNAFFMQRRNRAGRIGLSSLQKITIAIRLLAYRTSSDSFDECLRFATTMARERLNCFRKTVINVYSVS